MILHFVSKPSAKSKSIQHIHFHPKIVLFAPYFAGTSSFWEDPPWDLCKRLTRTLCFPLFKPTAKSFFLHGHDFIEVFRLLAVDSYAMQCITVN